MEKISINYFKKNFEIKKNTNKLIEIKKSQNLKE